MRRLVRTRFTNRARDGKFVWSHANAGNEPYPKGARIARTILSSACATPATEDSAVTAGRA